MALPSFVEVNRRLATDDAAQIRAHHRPYYLAFKTRVADDGDFRAIVRRSLEALVVQGYAAGDIAMMCGVTRSRAAQWMVEYRITRAPASHGTQLRLWDAALAHFRPLTRADFKRTLLRRVRSPRDEARRVERRAMVLVVRTLRGTLSRDPTIAEIVRAVGRPATYIARLWTCSGVTGCVRPNRCWRGWNRLRRLAGCLVIPPVVRCTHDRSSGDRYCRVCNAAASQRDYRRRAHERPWAVEGAAVRRLRERQAMSIRSLATCLGVYRNRVSEWERGLLPIPPRHWPRLAMVLALPRSEVVRCFPRAF